MTGQDPTDQEKFAEAIRKEKSWSCTEDIRLLKSLEMASTVFNSLRESDFQSRTVVLRTSPSRVKAGL